MKQTWANLRLPQPNAPENAAEEEERLPDQDNAAAERLLPPIRVFRKEGFEKEENPARIPDQEILTSSPSLLHPEDGRGGEGVLAEEEEEEVERRQGDGQDIGALAAGARSQKRTRGQKK